MSSFSCTSRSAFASSNNLNIHPYNFIDIAFNHDEMYDGIYNDKKKHNSDIELVLQRSKECNVRKLIITGTTSDDSIQAIDFSKKH